jgi:hypothetical protein
LELQGRKSIWFPVVPIFRDQFPVAFAGGDVANTAAADALKLRLIRRGLCPQRSVARCKQVEQQR